MGEHDTTTNPDCKIIGGRRKICAPPSEEYGVEMVITHEGYSISKKENDVGLIRLDRDVEYKSNYERIKSKFFFNL